ncbi:MBL fold metallo-hydrolase [Roseburia sp. 499]|uniref:MBL fold metallo-hydrolase n=1 Tax=Roseburia sp. 499 TaxID=1261634 RepID=UPI0009513802|nr:MBL fold metallo-hydrolase [Roseburia sp. 499]WVK70531.1 MBL fold metallo-hydrolase [Roseburia sp. 499]
MTEIKVESYVVSDFGTNCYFVINTETKETLIVDPGDNATMLAAKIEDEQLKPVAILLTHGHLDHASAAEELAKKFEVKIYAHEAEKETLEDSRMNLTAAFGAAKVFHADVFLKDDEILELIGCKIKVLFTPGHTPGGCCYYFNDQRILFSGDTLFCESVGRTDFPGGSSSTLIRSIREKLLNLSDDIKVYPGHMAQTSIGTEKMYNPFI